MSSSVSSVIVVVVCVLAVTTMPAVAAPTADHDGVQPSVDANAPIESSSSGETVARLGSGYAQSSQLSNTITIQSTSDERANYTITVSERIEPGSGADTEDDAVVPDEASGTRATGSTAEGGEDSFQFAGEVTSFSVSGGPVTVLVNGEEVDPDSFSETPPTTTTTTTTTETPTPTPTPTPTTTQTPTPTPTPTDTPTPTPTPTATPTPTPTETATQTETETQTATPASTDTATATQTPTTTEATTEPPRTIATDVTTTPGTTANETNTTGASGESGGILSNLSLSTLAFVFGLLLVVVFGVAALVARRRDSRPATALDSDSK